MRGRTASIIITAVVTIAACGEADDTTSAPVASTPVASTPVASTSDASTPVASTTVATTAAATRAPEPALLFADTFDDDRNGWGEIDDGEFGTIDIVDGDQRWIDATGRVLLWGPAALIEPLEQGDLDLADVTIRAHVTLVSGTGVIGVACRVVPDTDAELQWYDFVVRDGYAAIRRSDDQSHIEVLAEQDEAAVPFGAPVEIEATCRDDDQGGAHLTLALDGTTLLEVTDDSPIENGWAAPVAWSFPVHSPIEAHWHEFSVFSA